MAWFASDGKAKGKGSPEVHTSSSDGAKYIDTNELRKSENFKRQLKEVRAIIPALAERSKARA